VQGVFRLVIIFRFAQGPDELLSHFAQGYGEVIPVSHILTFVAVANSMKKNMRSLNGTINASRVKKMCDGLMAD
jgi:hypothetical protein